MLAAGGGDDKGFPRGDVKSGANSVLVKFNSSRRRCCGVISSIVPRQLHLLVFGNTRSAGPWRHPELDNSPAGVRRRLFERARVAESGGLDAMFFADGLNFGPPATWAYKTTEDFEPLTEPQ
jgi:hypothetical protein